MCKLTNSSTTEFKFQYFTIIIVIVRRSMFTQMAQLPQTIDQQLIIFSLVK